MRTNKIHISRIITSQRLDATFHRGVSNFDGYVSLSQYAEIKGGKRIPKGDTFSEEDTNYLYLRLSDIDNFETLDYNKFKCISEKLYKQLSRYEIHENELAISIAGTIGKVFLVKNIPDEKNVILTENCAKIILKTNNVLPEYIKIILNTDIVQEQINTNRIQTTIPKIGLDRIGKLQIPPVPSIEVQREVVEIYTKAQNEKQAKEKQATEHLASINAYLLDQFGITLPEKQDYQSDRFYIGNISSLLGERYDTNYHKPYFEKAFDELRKSKYGLKTLKELSSVITSGITPLSGGDAYTNAEDGVAFIRSGDIDIDGDINFDNLLYIKPEIHNKKMKSSKVYDNDIMIAIVGATIGQVGIYHSDKEANINQAIALVRLKGDINHEYIKELIKSAIGQLNLDRLKRPVARANINLEEVSTITIPIPPIEIQNEIADHITVIRNNAKQLQQDGAALLAEAKTKIEKIILG